MFAVRIVTTDHYQADPVSGLDVQYSDFRGSDVRKVPVVRVFGSTAAGQKTCMHIHGVFPYIYVPYDGTQPWDRYMRQFAASVDKAINVAQGNANSNFQHVFKITLVSGIPMYGYHAKEQQFLKIYFYNPNIIRKVADLLLGGAVLNKVFQPHESHIPYTLQLFIDYNLYGMNMLNVAAVKFRRKGEDLNANPVEEDPPQGSQDSDSSLSLRTSQDSILNATVSNTQHKVWSSDNIPSDMYLDGSVVRQSVCELEVDVVAADILNRLEVDANIGTNPGLAALWEDERQRRRNHGESSQITPPGSQEHDNVIMAESDRIWMEKFHQIILDQEPYMDSQSDSISESSQDDIVQIDANTQASEVELHLSQQEDVEDASQDTLMMDDSDDDPVINVESIHRVLSTSQSFIATPPATDEAQDKTLAQILASLAAESSPQSSQEAASQITVLEERDSILRNNPVLPDPEEEIKDEHETLEMSQCVWESDDSQDNGQKEVKTDHRKEGTGHNLEGMDETWEDSQLRLHLDSDSEEEKIPQLDGTDDKPVKPGKQRKRLGTRGPVFERHDPSANSSHQDQGHMSYDNNFNPLQRGSMMNPQYPGQPMTNQQGGYQQYENYVNRNWAHHGYPGSPNAQMNWNQGTSSWMPSNSTSPSQSGMLGNQQYSSSTAQANIHLSQGTAQSPHHVYMQQKNQQAVYSTSQTGQVTGKVEYGKNWSGQKSNMMPPGQSQIPHGNRHLQSPPNVSHHYNQQSHTYQQAQHRSYQHSSNSGSGTNRSLHEGMHSPLSYMHAQSPPQHIQSQKDSNSTPRTTLTPLRNVPLTPPETMSPLPPSQSSVTSPHYQSTQHRTASIDSSQSYSSYSGNTNSLSVQSFQKSKTAKNLALQYQHKSLDVSQNLLQSSQSQMSSVGLNSNDEICPGQRDVCRNPSGSSQESVPSSLEKMLMADDSQDSNRSITSQRCSSVGSVNSNASNQSRISEQSFTPNQNARQLSEMSVSKKLAQISPTVMSGKSHRSYSQEVTPSKMNISNNSQKDLFNESMSSRSSFSPLESSKNNGSFLNDGHSSLPSHTADSDTMNNSLTATYLTPADLGDYRPSASLTTLTRLESLVSNVAGEQTYGTNLEKCVKGKPYQSKKQSEGRCSTSTVNRPPSYTAWSDTESSQHYGSPDMSGHYMHQSQTLERYSPQDRHQYRSHSLDSPAQSGYYYGQGEYGSPAGESVLHQMQTVSQNSGSFSQYSDSMMQNDGYHGYPYGENMNSYDGFNDGGVGQGWSDRYQQSINPDTLPQHPSFSSEYHHFSRSEFNRSVSMPMPEKRKRGRPKGFKVNKPKPVSVSSIPAPKNLAYTFTFHVPTPVYKRLKLKRVCERNNGNDNIKIVRMHPKDARKYSLLKIGREVVKISKLNGKVLREYLGDDGVNQIMLMEKQSKNCRSSSVKSKHVDGKKELGTADDICKEKEDSNIWNESESNDTIEDNDSDNNDKFLGVSMSEFIPSDVKKEEKMEYMVFKDNAKSGNSKEMILDKSSAKECKIQLTNVNTRKIDLKSSENVLDNNSTDEINTKLDDKRCFQNSNVESSFQTNDCEYRRIAAVTLSSIIDRVIHNSLEEELKKPEKNMDESFDSQSGKNNVHSGQVSGVSGQQRNFTENVVPEQNYRHQENIVQYVTADLPIFNHHRNCLQNVPIRKDKLSTSFSNGDKHFMNHWNYMNSQQISKPKMSKLSKIGSQVPPRKEKRKYVKQNQKIVNRIPPNICVIDPDMDDIHHIVLKDVSLTEATDGTITPLKSRTPIAGRSPARSGCGIDQYKLFDVDLMSKLGTLGSDLDIPDQNSRIFSSDILSEKEISSSESNIFPNSDIQTEKFKNGESQSFKDIQVDGFKNLEAQSLGDIHVAKCKGGVSEGLKDIHIDKSTNEESLQNVGDIQVNGLKNKHSQTLTDIHIENYKNGKLKGVKEKSTNGVLQNLGDIHVENPNVEDSRSLDGILDNFKNRDSEIGKNSDTGKSGNGNFGCCIKRKDRILSRLASDFNENYLGTANFCSKRRKSSVNRYSPTEENTISPHAKREQKKKKKEEMEYIIIGKFKGHKKMVVSLDRIDLENDSVNVHDLPFLPKSYEENLSVSNQELDQKTSKENINLCGNDSSSNEKDSVLEHCSVSSNESLKNYDILKDGCNKITQETSECPQNNMENDARIFSEDSLNTDDSKAFKRINKLSLTKKKCLEQKNPKYFESKVVADAKNPPSCVNVADECCDSDGSNSPVIPVSGTIRETTEILPEGWHDQEETYFTPISEKVKLKRAGIVVSDLDNFSRNSPKSSVGMHGTSSLNSEDLTNFSKQAGTNVNRIDHDERESDSCSEILSSFDESSKSGNNSEKEDGNISKPGNCGFSEQDSDSRSSVDIPSGRHQSKSHKKKKNLTRSQRLQVAFVGTKPKRRKMSNKAESKLMSSLSLLHQATLANLHDQNENYNDDVDDFRVNYQDTMSKMAMLSPPDSDKGSNSPPLPLSPEEFEKQKIGSKLQTGDTKNRFSPRGTDMYKLNPLVSKNIKGSQLHIKIEELRRKQMEKLAKVKEINIAGNVQTGCLDCVYETPLSSVETLTGTTSKSPVRFSPIDSDPCHLKSGTSSDSDCQIIDCDTSMDNSICEQVRIQNLSHLQLKIDLVSEAKVNISRARVKIKKLSSEEVENYCKVSKKSTSSSSDEGSGQLSASPCRKRRNRSVSPPDLGPPNIPSDLGPPNIPRISAPCIDNDNSKSPPPLDDLTAPKLCAIDITASTDGIELPSTASPSKSPASSSLSSFHVVHCDTFSDISDDESCDDVDTSFPKNSQNSPEISSASFSFKNSPNRLSPCMNNVVLNTVSKLTAESSVKDTSTLNCAKLSPKNLNRKIDQGKSDEGSKTISQSVDGKHCHPKESIGDKSENSNIQSETTISSNIESITSSQPKNRERDLEDLSLLSSSSVLQGKIDTNEKYQEKIKNDTKKTVLMPQNDPPSRKSVTDTAVTHGLSVAINQDAFCSNADDLPDKPRELGGRILKVQSNRVKDLREFETSTKCDGLNTWRDLLIANDEMFTSQTDNTSLLTKINEQPSLRFAIMPDRNVIISPCRPPPSKTKVESWARNRKLYKSLKNKMKKFSADTQHKNGLANKSLTKSDNKLHSELHKSDKNLDKFEFCDNGSFQIVKNSDGDDKNLKVKIVRCKNQANSNPCSDSRNKTLKVDKNSDELMTKPNEKTNSSMLDDEIIDLTTEDCDDVELEIISPSPPKDIIKSKFKSKLFKTCTPLKPDSNANKNIHSTPVLKHSTDVLGANNSLISTPVHRQTPKSLFEVRFTPICIEKSVSFKDDISIDEGLKPITEEQPGTNLDVQTPKFARGFKPISEEETTTTDTDVQTPKFALPKTVPQSKRLSMTSEKTLFTSQTQDYSTPGTSRAGVSQIDAATPKNSFGFKVSQHNLQSAKAVHEAQHLTVLSLEVHTESRGELKPDPEIDAIIAVFYCIHNDVLSDDGKRDVTGAIIVDKLSAQHQAAARVRNKWKHSSSDDVISHDKRSKDRKSKSRSPSPEPSTSHDSPQPSTSHDLPRPSTSHDYTKPSTSHCSPMPSTSNKGGNVKDSADTGSDAFGNTLFQKSGIFSNIEVNYVADEKDLFQTFIDLIAEWDPDILVGYEIQMLSLGYLLQRAAQLSIDLCNKLSRIPGSKTGSHFSAEKDEWGADYSSEIHIVGRIVLNLWRILKHEVTLNVYTFENVAFHVLHQRIPLFSFKILNSWFNHRTHLYRWRVVGHYITRVKGNMQIMDQLDLIGRTSEFARVFGIEFYHVLSRGSQYRVESMMLRLAKPLNFIPVSPSVHQRARMKAPECIQLTLEPESKFYPDPVVVLDFQSLYPSIMIAYNYCFSTCLGRVDWLKKAHEGPIEFGCTSLNVPPSDLKKLKDDVTVSPNGIAFVKQHVRKGVISAMVEEILNTRLMVKKAMKEYKNDKGLHRLLDARQLGLKLIANVTYGYTAANFSGRMPCVEVADSIVRKGRETLERAIKLVEDTPKWGAKVVYGDTDSLFILLKGRSKDDAFKIGYEICDAVTNMNPKPIKLKFEKVYLPCALETKKRYVGFMYETPDQKEPVYDAKGIETVRRDSCSAVSKILEKSIKILFTTRDVSKVKQYVQTQCRKLMEGKVSMQDCIFAKEYRGMPGYKPGACVPALEIAKKCLRQDRRSEPRVGERVPYVIVYGTPGLPLIKLVRQPMELILDPTLRLNSTYYITKQILPPLNRLFSLVGVDVFTWYNEMPKFVRIVPHSMIPQETKKGTISQYFSAVNCPVCDQQTNQSICNRCMSDPQTVAIVLNSKIRHWEKVYQDLVKFCNTCMRTQDEKQPCISLDCPIFFRRVIANLDVSKGTQLRDVVNKALDF